MNTHRSGGRSRELIQAKVLSWVTLTIVGCASSATDMGLPRLLELTVDSVASTEPGKVLVSQALFSADDSSVILFHRNEISVIRRNGGRNVTYGREGAGPGEFSAITRAGRVGRNRFWILDTRLNRLTMFDPGFGTLEGQNLAYMPSLVGETLVSWSGPRAVLPDGTALNSGTRAGGAPLPGTEPESVGRTVLGWTPQGPSHPGVLVIVPGSTNCHEVVGNRSIRIPECPREHFAVSPRGDAIVTAFPVAGLSAGQYHLVQVDGSGDTVYSTFVRLPTDTIPDVWWDGQLEVMHQSGLPVSEGELTRPLRWDPVRYLKVGDDRATWVAGYVVGGIRTWTVIDPGGAVVGAFQVPEEWYFDDVSVTGAWMAIDQEAGPVSLYRATLQR